MLVEAPQPTPGPPGLPASHSPSGQIGVVATDQQHQLRGLQAHHPERGQSRRASCSRGANDNVDSGEDWLGGLDIGQLRDLVALEDS